MSILQQSDKFCITCGRNIGKYDGFCLDVYYYCFECQKERWLRRKEMMRNE